jgi:hypothetical protein
MENKESLEEDIDQDYVYIDYFTDGIFRYSQETREFPCKHTIILKTLKNETFFPQCGVNCKSILRQFSLDFFRNSSFINSQKINNPDELLKYVEKNPFLRINKDNILLMCTQIIMLFPLYLLYKFIGPIVVGERENKTGMQIYISATNVLVTKYLRSVNPSNISNTLQTFEVFIDTDFTYDETTIMIVVEQG